MNPNPISPLEVLDKFVLRGISSSGMKNDLYRLTTFCRQHNGRSIDQINRQHVDAWIATLETRFDSRASVETYKQSLCTFFNWCVKNQYIADSPAAHISYARRLSARNKAANRRDIERVIKSLMAQMAYKPSRLIVRDLLAIMLSYESGGRLGELARLTTKEMAAALRHPQMSASGTVVYMARSYGKNGFVSIKFTERTAALYRLWQQKRPPRKSPRRVFIALGGLHSGQPLTKSGYTAIFCRRCKEVGVPIFRTHALRHRKGTDVVDRYGAKIASQVLEIKVETVMLHYYNEEFQTVIDAVGSM